jgi:hypothetical protein
MPPAVQSQFGEQDRKLLLKLRRDHLQRLMDRAQEIRQLLTPLLRSLGAAGSGPITPAEPAADWQTATGPLFAATQNVDRALTTLLTVNAPSQPEEAVAAADRSLAEFLSVLDAYPHD